VDQIYSTTHARTVPCHRCHAQEPRPPKAAPSRPLPWLDQADQQQLELVINGQRRGGDCAPRGAGPRKGGGKEWGERGLVSDLEERVAAVRRRAVGADAGAAPEAEDVLLVLLAGLVRGAADEEGLRDQAGDPPAGHHPHLSVPRRTGSPAPPPLGRLGREGGRNSLSLSLSLFSV
jgi:hypothetical protein